MIIEYVAAPLELDGSVAELGAVVEKFNKREDGYAATYVKPEDVAARHRRSRRRQDDDVRPRAGRGGEEEEHSQHEDVEDEDDDGGGGSRRTATASEQGSNKQAKPCFGMTVAELKQLCARRGCGGVGRHRRRIPVCSCT